MTNNDNLSNTPTGFELWSYHGGLPINPYGVPAAFLLRLTGSDVSGVFGPMEAWSTPHFPSSNLLEWFDLPFRTERQTLQNFEELRSLTADERDERWHRDHVVESYVVRDLLRHRANESRRNLFVSTIIFGALVAVITAVILRG